MAGSQHELNDPKSITAMPMGEQPALEIEAAYNKRVDDLISKTLASFRVELKALYEARLQEQEERIASLEMDLACMKDNHEKEQDRLRTENDALKDNLRALNAQIINIEKKANNNEQYSRRNNLRFRGVVPTANESPSAAIVRAVNGSLQFGNDASGKRLCLTEEEIEVAHFLKARPPTTLSDFDVAPSAPQPSIIVRFFDRNWRDRIIRARSQLKGTRLIISEDLTPANQKVLTQLKALEHVDKAWSWNGKLHYTLKNQRKTYSIQIRDPLPDA